MTFLGKEIMDISSVNNNTAILIAANPVYNIHERLLRAGIEKWEYIDPEFMYLLCEGNNRKKIEHILKTNEENISQVYSMLGDEKSKQVYRSVLQHRIEHNLALINDIYDENQYFGNDIINTVSGNFVDCGAFNGDTLKRFLKQIGNEQYNYYAFEAEKANYNDLISYCKKYNIKNVNAYNMAIYSSKTQLSFSTDDNQEKVSGKISELESNNYNYVQADSIDNILANQKIDTLIMDIEGAELHALNGANKSINKWHPKLAISAYHMIEHLWEVPLLIHNINPNYQIFFRHHRWNMDDTVCYALYKD
ncbi:MAG: FkbM family methyltransferase [Clostridium sp.]|nr:FkbM family methyltransferase [Clostridium sp.]